jgi:dTDP-4-dehydrorhamnose 3,5-epimerase
MNVHQTPIQGLLRLEPRQFTDDRGRFIVTYDQRMFDEAVGHPVRFIQDNESTSRKGVVRGLHFQLPPAEQGKLVHVIRGSVLDVCVDIRPGSATFGQHFKAVLDHRSKVMLWIPPGFAHGFRSLEDETVFSYKCTSLYQPTAERCIRWDDKDLAIDWGTDMPIVSAKDAEGGGFREREWWPAG